MKRFMLLHVGFEQPTPEIMQAWQKWFEDVAERTVEHGGLRNGRELSADRAKDLPWDLECLTGYSIINAESQEEAEAIARANPFVTAIRVYEIAAQ